MSAVPLHHEIAGPPDGRPLVLLHSIGTSLAVWRPAAERLAAVGVRTIACDLRGHGGTPVGETPSTPDAPWTLADLAGDVLALVEELALDRSAVAGVSLGGMVGLWMAAHEPERVSHLAACCTGARLAPSSMWEERAALVREGGCATIADAVLERWFAPGFAEERPQVVAGVRATLEGTAPEGYAGAADAIAAADLRDDLARIACPTLVIGGAEDPATPVADQAEPLHAAIAGSELVVLDGCSHLAPLEDPETTADALLALVARPA